MQYASTPSFNTTRHRYMLSPRGYAAEAVCPVAAYPTSPDGSWDRLSSERAQWAYSHGLRPVDGAYLRELRRRRLTMSQMSEALAAFGQSAQMVHRAVARLQRLEMLEVTLLDDAPQVPQQQAIDRELAAALEELGSVLADVDAAHRLDRRTASVAIRRAMGRVVAARRWCGA